MNENDTIERNKSVLKLQGLASESDNGYAASNSSSGSDSEGRTLFLHTNNSNTNIPSHPPPPRKHLVGEDNSSNGEWSSACSSGSVGTWYSNSLKRSMAPVGGGTGCGTQISAVVKSSAHAFASGGPSDTGDIRLFRKSSSSTFTSTTNKTSNYYKQRTLQDVDVRSMETPIYHLGTDAMAQTLQYLEPNEVYCLLSYPFSQTWRTTYTMTQELWRVMCLSKPFFYKSPEAWSSSSDSDDSTVDTVKEVYGKYRLMYASFVRCMAYLYKIQLHKPDDFSVASNFNISSKPGLAALFSDVRRRNRRRIRRSEQTSVVVSSSAAASTSRSSSSSRTGSSENDVDDEVILQCSSISNSSSTSSDDEYVNKIRHPQLAVDALRKTKTSSSKRRRNGPCSETALLDEKKPLSAATASNSRGNGSSSSSSSSSSSAYAAVRKRPLSGTMAPPQTKTTSSKSKKKRRKLLERDFLFPSHSSPEEPPESRPHFGHSQLTAGLFGPSKRSGLIGHVDLPWSCAIYSVINWMVGFQDVMGIQVMCLRTLPRLLEDESQRTVAQRTGATDHILHAMLMFPHHEELHTVALHSIVLLARPLGGKEGMLFGNAMNNSSGIFNSKTRTGQNGIAVVLDSMRRFHSNPVLQAMGCWAMVNIALIPTQKVMLVKLGGITVALNAMLNHSTNREVQYRALFSLINLVIPSDLLANSDEARSLRTSLGEELDSLSEREVVDECVEQIIHLVVLTMIRFSQSDVIVNRGCLVLHNLSITTDYIPLLVETPYCYQIMDWAVENYRRTDRMLAQSAAGTMKRMQTALSNDSELRRRFAASLHVHNRLNIDGPVIQIRDTGNSSSSSSSSRAGSPHQQQRQQDTPSSARSI